MKAAYLRVSTNEQKKGKTIKGQELAIRKFLGKEPDKVYKEENWSGAVLQRPQLDKLREDIRNGKIKELYIYHPDRLSRKQSYQFILLDEIQKAGVKIIFTSLPDFFEGTQESQVVNKSIFGMVAELERLRISERFRLGKLRKVEEGKIISSKAPYGFKKTKDSFVHEPHEIKVVELILNLALEGKSDNEIIQELLKRGIKTRTGKSSWAKSSIHKLLKTNLSVYTGVWYYNKHRQTIPVNPTSLKKYKHSEKTSTVLNNKEDWIKVELPKHLAIITKEQANTIRRYKSKNRAVKKGNVKHNYLLQGKIYCSSCFGLNYCDTFHRVPYYRCADRKRSYPYASKCPGGSIKGETLENEVWNRLIKLITNPELIKREAENYIKRNIQEKVEDSESTELIKRKLALQKEKDKLAEGYTKGLIDDESMARQSRRIKEEELLVAQDERVLSRRQEKVNGLDLNTLIESIDTLVKEAKEVLKDVTFEEKRNLLSWLNVSVNYFKHAYSIKGGIPILNKHSTKLHTINL